VASRVSVRKPDTVGASGPPTAHTVARRAGSITKGLGSIVTRSLGSDLSRTSLVDSKQIIQSMRELTARGKKKRKEGQRNTGAES
jgi:hypothetical protein